MELKHNDIVVNIQFNTYGLYILAKLLGKIHPFDLYSDELYLGRYENHIHVIQAGLSGASGTEISFMDAAKAIDTLGGVQEIDWEAVYAYLMEASAPNELAVIIQKYKTDNKKKVRQPTTKTGQRKSSPRSKLA